MKCLFIRHAHKQVLIQKHFTMKRVVLILTLIMSIATMNGQKSLDRLFEKYSDQEEFTCITISGNLLNIAANLDNDDDGKEIKAKITDVRILTAKNDYSNAVDFNNILRKEVDLKGYDEFLRIKESDHDLKVMVRSQGKRITEMLLIAGGDDKAIIQVKGNMSVSDAKRLCDNARGRKSYDISWQVN